MKLCILSPSGAIDPQYIQDAKQRLEQRGIVVSEGRHARSIDGRFAGTDAQRLSDLKAALEDESVDAILCSRGGYGLQRLALNLGSLQVTKPIIGFSDITVLHQWSSLHGVPSLHGLMCKHIATLDEHSEALSCWWQAVEGKPLHYRLKSHPLSVYGKTSGLIIGGNLSVLYGLQGTPLSLKAVCQAVRQRGEQPILFIEDIAERHYHIERMLLNLKMSGVLASLAGVIVGQFSDCEDDPSMGETIQQTIARILAPYPYPVWMDFPAGHVEDNRPLWFSRKMTMTLTPVASQIVYGE